MEDMIEQYRAAAADLRDLLREAHEVLRDLRDEARIARSAMAKYEADSVKAARKRVDEAEKEMWEKLKFEFVPKIDETADRINDMLLEAQENTCGLIADAAGTLALAMRVKSPDAAGTVADIARATQTTARSKRLIKQRRKKITDSQDGTKSNLTNL